MEILGEILLILAAAGGVLLLSHALRIPGSVGFLVTGAAIGPHALGLVHDIHHVEILAEVGVILLLFTIGLEFSFAKLMSIRRTALLGGSLQLLFTLILVWPLVSLSGVVESMGEGIFLGLLAALSSTAIVLKLLQERGESGAPHGRGALGILIFQDLAVVPMMLITPFLAGKGGSPLTLALLGLKTLAVTLLVLAVARKAAPWMLARAAATRDREFFLLTVVVICLAVAFTTNAAGLSLALGAFLAGLVVAETDFSHQATAHIMPFHDLFICFFFISIGMLLDVGYMAQHLPLVLGATLLVMLGKLAAIVAAGLILGLPLRVCLPLGLALCQVGEFAFVLFKHGVGFGMLEGGIYQLFLAVSVTSMLAAPFLIAAGPAAARLAQRLPLPARLRDGIYNEQSRLTGGEFEHLENHMVVIGYGLAGRFMVRAARTWCTPYVIVEGNPETVRRERAAGEPIFFGDASRAPILHHARIERASAVVVAISDPVATRQIVRIVRDLAPSAFIVARTRFLPEIDELKKLGASEVIPEDYETAVEMLVHVLRRFHVPREEIRDFVENVREGGYAMQRPLPADRTELCEYSLPNIQLRRVLLRPGGTAAGRSVGEIGLRSRHGLTLLAFRRGAESHSLPGPESVLQAGDVLLVAGREEDLRAAAGLFGESSGDQSPQS